MRDSLISTNESENRLYALTYIGVAIYIYTVLTLCTHVVHMNSDDNFIELAAVIEHKPIYTGYFI